MVHLGIGVLPGYEHSAVGEQRGRGTRVLRGMAGDGKSRRSEQRIDRVIQFGRNAQCLRPWPQGSNSDEHLAVAQQGGRVAKHVGGGNNLSDSAECAGCGIV